MSTAPGRELTSFGQNFVKTRRHDTYPGINPKDADLSGKHVLITGVSKGVGRAMAMSYARGGASAIVITARSDLSSIAKEVEAAAQVARGAKPRVIPLQLDVTSRKSVEAATNAVSSQLGHLDILVQNAGFMEHWVPMIDSDPDIWWKTYETNIFGTYLILRSFLPLLIASPKPDKTVVCLTSAGALHASPGGSSYQSGKLAIIRLTEFVMAEYGDQGVSCYAIHPGGVKSEMSVKMPDYMHGVLNDTAELSGDTIVFLTRERRAWLGGRYIDCGWDMQEFLAKRKVIEDGDLLKVRMAVD